MSDIQKHIKDLANIVDLVKSLITECEKVERLIIQYGQIDGDHHKAWVLDQVMRIIKGKEYDKFVHDYEYNDEYGIPSEEKIYLWDTGVAP